MPLASVSLGPLTKGVISAANPSLDLTGALKRATNSVYSGIGQLMARPGDETAITLKDDAGTPATVTSVLAVVPFNDGALAVAHSTATQKVYLYRLDSLLTGWYNFAGTFTASSTATPLATALWTGIATAPAVTIAEGLGVAYIAHNTALDASALNWPTRAFDQSAGTIANITADIDGTAGAETIYFLGVFSFQDHLWGWGFDKSATASTAYRPELLRHSSPDFGALDANGGGSFKVGHRVRSARERIIGACVVGEIAYVGTATSVWPVTGYGRDSWEKSRPLSESFGFAGLKSACAANSTCYYWSLRGPLRVAGLTQPEPLWDPIQNIVASVANPEQVVAVFDADRNQVLFIYGGTTFCAYDVNQDCWAAGDSAFGLSINCGSMIAPVYTVSSAAPGPAGPPTTAVTSSVGATVATASWTAGDTTSGVTTLVEFRRQGTTTYATAFSGTGSTAVISGLTANVAYEWRATHYKNGQASAALGPAAATQFTTLTSTLNVPTGLSIVADPDAIPAGNARYFLVQWTNSGEADVLTQVRFNGPSASEPTTWTLFETVANGVSSSNPYTLTGGAGKYWTEVRHVRADLSSAWTTSASVTVT